MIKKDEMIKIIAMTFLQEYLLVLMDNEKKSTSLINSDVDLTQSINLGKQNKIIKNIFFAFKFLCSLSCLAV